MYCEIELQYKNYNPTDLNALNKQIHQTASQNLGQNSKIAPTFSKSGNVEMLVQSELQANF